MTLKFIFNVQGIAWYSFYLYLQDTESKPTDKRSIRTDDKNLLMVPKTRTITYGDRSFLHCGPTFWNVRAVDLKHCDDFNQFKSLLKTHLFFKAYPYSE